MELYFGNNAYNVNDNIIYESYSLNEDEQNKESQNNKSSFENVIKKAFSNDEIAQKIKNLLDGKDSQKNSSIISQSEIEGLNKLYYTCSTFNIENSNN